MSVDERLERSVALEQAYVHDVYAQFSDNPRARPWPKVQHFLEALEPGSLVCDVGCGNGKYLNINPTTFTMGGDKCERLCEVAREKENEVMILDNLSLPLRDESMDAVLSIAVVHHFATTERRVCALRELARVLRIGGRLIISVWAMEQSNRKFESQDVLVPWHRPAQHLSTPSLELASTATTSEEDIHPAYQAYTQSDSDSPRSNRAKANSKKRSKTKHRGRSIDPQGRNYSPSSSSLSSPNETCYSFVRRAIQKLAGGRRVGAHRPWFLESWSACAKEPVQRRYDPDGCDCSECDNVQDLPIELRRVDDEDGLQQRRQTFPSSQLINDLYASLKSRSMTNIKTVENNNVVKRSQSGVCEVGVAPESRPKLVKQKKSVCEEDEEEVGGSVVAVAVGGRYGRANVLKQRSLNEELMSRERLREKERVRQNIQKQASLNEELIYQRHRAFDSFRDSLFNVKRLQLIKTGFANKFKTSATIDKVTGASLKNGFVRIFQNWKSSDLISPTIPEDEVIQSPKSTAPPPSDDKKEETSERRSSKEDGSDSSKDSSLQSDTSVDSEDSFASVIFIPKSDPMSPQLSPGPASPRLNTSLPNSPRIKQSSCPTSPRIKQVPLSIYPLTKQMSSPKPTTIKILEAGDEKRKRSFGEDKEEAKWTNVAQWTCDATKWTTDRVKDNKCLAQGDATPTPDSHHTLCSHSTHDAYSTSDGHSLNCAQETLCAQSTLETLEAHSPHEAPVMPNAYATPNETTRRNPFDHQEKENQCKLGEIDWKVKKGLKCDTNRTKSEGGDNRTADHAKLSDNHGVGDNSVVGGTEITRPEILVEGSERSNLVDQQINAAIKQLAAMKIDSKNKHLDQEADPNGTDKAKSKHKEDEIRSSEGNLGTTEVKLGTHEDKASDEDLKTSEDKLKISQDKSEGRFKTSGDKFKTLETKITSGAKTSGVQIKRTKDETPDEGNRNMVTHERNENSKEDQAIVKTKPPKAGLASKYAVQPIPKFRSTTLEVPRAERRGKAETFRKIKDFLNKKPLYSRRANFPLVRRSSISDGKEKPVVKPLPKLLSLELFNPETDDDSDDAGEESDDGVSSPDSIGSVISAGLGKKGFLFGEASTSRDAFGGCEDALGNLRSRLCEKGRSPKLEERNAKEKCNIGTQITKDGVQVNKDGVPIDKDSVSITKDSVSINKDSVSINKDCVPVNKNSVRINKDGSTNNKDGFPMKDSFPMKEESGKIDKGSPNNTGVRLELKKELIVNPKENTRVDARIQIIESPVTSTVPEKKMSRKGISKQATLRQPESEIEWKTRQEVAKTNLFEAAANVAHSLDEAVEKVIERSPQARRRQLKSGDIISVIQRQYSMDNRQYSLDNTPLLSEDGSATDLDSWDDNCHRHLTDFADQLSEKLLREIDQYQEQKRKDDGSSGDMDDPYINRLSEELQDLSKLSAEIQKQNEYLAKLSVSDRLLAANCPKCQHEKCSCRVRRKSDGASSPKNEICKETEKTLFKGNRNAVEVREMKESKTEDSLCSLERLEAKESKPKEDFDKLSTSKLGVKSGASVESCDSDKAATSGTSLSFGPSTESAESFSDRGSSDSHRDSNSVSRYSDGGSTASLASCPEWKTIKSKLPTDRSSSSEDRTEMLSQASDPNKRKEKAGMNPSLSDTSQESLPSDSMGGEITYHRYYHVFREGELDQLIEKYVENLHIISSYYDHASWCVIAEKVQVWTI